MVQTIMVHVLSTVWQVSPTMVIGLFVLIAMAITLGTLIVYGERSMRAISHVHRDDYVYAVRGTDTVIEFPKDFAKSKPATVKGKINAR